MRALTRGDHVPGIWDVSGSLVAGAGALGGLGWGLPSSLKPHPARVGQAPPGAARGLGGWAGWLCPWAVGAWDGEVQA